MTYKPHMPYNPHTPTKKTNNNENNININSIGISRYYDRCLRLMQEHEEGGR